MSRRSKLAAAVTDPAQGWDARLWRLWALYSALAYTVILVVVWVLAGVGWDATRVALKFPVVGTFLIVSSGALLYGLVLGRLQWRVLRERIPIPRRAWVRASVIPALAVWIAVVVPAGVHAESTNGDLRVAYFLALSQALALGPLVGFSQARALRPYTRRWKAWIAANIVSWLLVDAAFYVVSLVLGAFDFVHGHGSPIESYVLPLAAAPLSGRWMLWVTAPAAAGADQVSGARAPAPR